MAIVRSKDGRYFDIPDKILKKHAIDARKISAAAPSGVQIIIEETGGGEVGGRMIYGGGDPGGDRHRCEAPRSWDPGNATRRGCQSNICCGVRG